MYLHIILNYSLILNICRHSGFHKLLNDNSVTKVIKVTKRNTDVIVFIKESSNV